MKLTYAKYLGAIAITGALVAITTLPAFAATNSNKNDDRDERSSIASSTYRGPGMMNGRYGNATTTRMMYNRADTERSDNERTATSTRMMNGRYGNATTTRMMYDRSDSDKNRTGTSTRMMNGRWNATSTNENQIPLITGNGRPVVAGTVSSVTGTTVTITTASNISYTVDVSSSTVNRNKLSSTASAIVVGDYVIVQGTVNGNSVVASSVIDSSVVPPNTIPPGGPGNMGFLGSVGGFFRHLFGF